MYHPPYIVLFFFVFVLPVFIFFCRKWKKQEKKKREQLSVNKSAPVAMSKTVFQAQIVPE
jgi:heme/copper-type cytochrome/quinol oxidase subunit 2